MSLLPFLVDECPYRRSAKWATFSDPDLEDLLPLAALLQHRRPHHGIHGHLKSHGDKNTTISHEKDHFQARVDIQQFKPEEVSVKLSDDNTVTVEGKHEERQDDHGFISRHFVRKYVLPEGTDLKKLKSKLSSDGVLSITAPKKQEAKQVEYKEIPIIRTGEPAKRIEQTPVENDAKKAKL
ncbi:alpha-crystallin A chain-like [Cylas formicarius]|uniref:alpha-crystallin A chain-like n=1 Tax=Cylas formicarius TaxID=197179 RepID=UPI002958CECD|nr:alpha-crystallin A chain-like [Cylas formicarius]